MNEQVTEYIQNIQLAWQTEICTSLRQIVLDTIPDVDERIQYNKPHYLKNGKYAAVIGTAKGWVSFTIFNAAGLDTPDDLFETSDSGDRKTIKIREGQAVDYDALAGYLQQAASTIA